MPLLYEQKERVILLQVEQNTDAENSRSEGEKRYVSEIAGELTFEPNAFNIVFSGTGTGKTEYVRMHIRDIFPDVQPCEICFVTSRSMIRDQQSLKSGFRKMRYGFAPIIREWNGEEPEDAEELPGGYIDGNDVWIMNIHQFIHILDAYSIPGERQLRNVRLIVFDEAHALYSDNFIPNILAVRVWIRERLCLGETMFLGLTATPEILLHLQRRHGIPVHLANRKPIVNYRAKHLITTTPGSVPFLFSTGKLTGKSIVMCPTLAQCRQMQKAIPNSEVLCSRNNKGFTLRMQHIRDYILRHEVLPPTVGDIDSAHRDDKSPVDVLIVTTTMREGINLCAASGIRNVVCCMPDSMNVVQFAGRCRKNIDNLVVAASGSPEEDGEEPGGFLHTQNLLFEAFAKDREDRRWFSGISHIVSEPFEKVERYEYKGDTERFRKELEEKFTGKRIASDSGGEELVELARQCGIFGATGKRYTFLYVLRAVENEFGYTVRTNKVRGKRFKTILPREKEETECTKETT